VIRALRANPAVWLMIAIGVVSLAAGLALGTLVTSPGQAAEDTDAPTSGLITVAAEERVLSNDVVIRGEAKFADAVNVTIETAAIDGPAVVTGQVPEVGAQLAAASVALEVVGRPVIVLPGELPVYRTFRVGVAGPDVTQLKQALAAVGINPGNTGSDVYDAATAAAVAALYASVGYPAPAAPEGTADAVRAAKDSLASAQQGLTAAQQSLAAAQAGPSTVDRLQADAAVASAQRALVAARALSPADRDAVASAAEALAIAEASRAMLHAPADVSTEHAGIAAAQQQLVSAQGALAEVQQNALTTLPASEVVFLADLPRRVDDVSVTRGATVEGSVMTVSGATLVIEASAAEADAALLAEGDTASIELPDGSPLAVTVDSLAQETGADATGRFEVLLTPDAITPEQLELVRGTSVKITVPVDSTGGAVLAVPIAALTAGPGGESRVEIAGEDDTTTIVEVATGLAAAGYVEIETGDLRAGDLVVVGR
jgi:multidrug efflux pump subunit AcrA (membrane-fusion protein)